MKNLICLIPFLFFIHGTYAQDKKVFTSLEEAMESPDEVYWLNLAGKELSEFPEEIFEFKNLELLDLSYNLLEELPEGMGSLTSVQAMDLNNNQLRSLPRSIIEMENLMELNISDNNLETLPDGLVLEHLNVQSNQLTDLPILGEYLLSLLADDNKFKTFPLSILETKNINVLGFALNDVTSLPLELSKLKYLQILWLTEGKEDSNKELLKQLKKKKGKFELELYSEDKYSGEGVLYGSSLNTMMFWH